MVPESALTLEVMVERDEVGISTMVYAFSVPVALLVAFVMFQTLKSGEKDDNKVVKRKEVNFADDGTS